jgi:hypothetical protein
LVRQFKNESGSEIGAVAVEGRDPDEERYNMIEEVLSRHLNHYTGLETSFAMERFR